MEIFSNEAELYAFKHKKTTNYVLVETVGVEPTSGDIGTRASTSLVDILYFTHSSAYQQASEELT